MKNRKKQRLWDPFIAFFTLFLRGTRLILIP